MTHTIDTTPEAIAALLDGVTPGPWMREAQTIYANGGYQLVASMKPHEWGQSWPQLERNGDFIAATRDLVPALAAEIARLTAERDEARVQVARWQADANLMLGFAQLAYESGANPSSSELIDARDRCFAARDAAMRNEGRRQAAEIATREYNRELALSDSALWDEYLSHRAAAVGLVAPAIIAALEPEGGE